MKAREIYWKLSIIVLGSVISILFIFRPLEELPEGLNLGIGVFTGLVTFFAIGMFIREWTEKEENDKK